MRGHSTTAPSTRPATDTVHPAPAARWRAAAGLFALGSLRRWGLVAAVGLSACGGGYYGDYVPAGFGGTVDGTGRLAVSWMLNGAALTPDRCQSERIDSMTVQVVSERYSQSSVEFINVVCGLSRYSMEHVPSGPVSVYVSAIRTLSSQRQCVRYAAIGHTTAADQFQQSPFPINLLTVTDCP